MAVQGALLVVAEHPATELVNACRAAGAFPIVETTWSDAPTAFAAFSPSAVVIAEPGAPASASAARLLCLQIATKLGPIVPVIARTTEGEEIALPIARPADVSMPIAGVVAMLREAVAARSTQA